METRFTPGPWKASSSESADSITISSEDGRHYIGLTGLQSNGTHRANAHLIAAAPDLYEALARMVKANEDWESAALDQAKTALSKARGE